LLPLLLLLLSTLALVICSPAAQAAGRTRCLQSECSSLHASTRLR
jgi:hypothetical protein